MSSYTQDFKVTVDAIVVNNDNQVLLVKRRLESRAFPGMWALPGGHLEKDEVAAAGALRELREETGIFGEEAILTGAYTGPNRDPRGAYVGLAYYIAGVTNYNAVAADDAIGVMWCDLDKLPPLAFDHAIMIEDAL